MSSTHARASRFLGCIVLFAGVVVALPESASAQFFRGFRGPVIGPPLIGPPVFGVRGPFGPPVIGIVPGIVAVPAPPVAIVPSRRVSSRYGYAVAPLPPAIALPPVLPSPYVAEASVNVSPYGNVSIRTPGFSLDTSPYGIAQVSAETSVGYPSSVEDAASVGFSTIDAESLQSALQTLSLALEARPDGEVWIDYLEPEVLSLAIESFAVERSPSAADSLRRALRPFDGIAANPQLSWLSSLSGFEVVRQGVRQWLGDGDAVSTQGSAPANVPTLAPQADDSAPSPVQPSDDGDSVLERAPVPPPVEPIGNKVKAVEELPAPQPAAATDSI